MTGPYDDMIELEHPVSDRRPHMPRIDRAAQFAPFAALTGYDDAIRETMYKNQRRTAKRNAGEVIFEEDSQFPEDL